MMGLCTLHLFTTVVYILQLCSAQPVIEISKTNVITKVGVDLEFTCDIQVQNTEGEEFKWQHTNAMGVKTEYSAQSSNSRVEVTDGRSSSLLRINNLVSEDSGQIRCIYEYSKQTSVQPDLGAGLQGKVVIDAVASVCVSEQPMFPPVCSYKETSLFCQLSNSQLCPDDITLQWTSNATLTSGSNATHLYNSLLLPSVSHQEHVCILKSELYPDVQLDCTITLPFNSPAAATTAFYQPTVTGENVSPIPFLSCFQCVWVTGVMAILVITATLSIIINILLGLKALSKSGKQLPAEHSPQVEDPYTELDIVDNKNAPDKGLNGGHNADARDKMAVPDAMTGNGAEGRNHEAGNNERYYANDWRAREIQN